MRIDLLNFFKYFDPKNAKHIAAVQQFQLDIEKVKPDLTDDSANWVRIYRTPVNPPPTNIGILSVPWYPQTDNYRDPSRTCNSSSCAMCLEYFKPGTLKGPQGDDDYIRKVFSIGDTTDHAVQTKVLQDYGVNSTFSYNLGFDDLDREIAACRPVVIGILHRGPLTAPTGGHMIVVIGKSGDDYVINDPYGSLNDGYSGPVTNGKGVVYKRSELMYRWLDHGKDKTGWGRIFDAKKPDQQQSTSASQPTKVPQPAIDLIKQFEGCSLKAYYDPLTGGLPITIGYGSTRRKDDSRFMIGNTITQQEADDLLNYQLQNDYLPSLQKIPHWSEMNENQQGALLSFAYNLGANFYGSSGFNTISGVLRDKEWDKVPGALMLYVNPGTNVEAGLTRRRKAEGDLWSK